MAEPKRQDAPGVPAEDVAAHLGVVRSLIDGFHEPATFEVRGRDQYRTRMVLGLATQAHWSAETFLVLRPRTSIEDTLTVCRRVFEHAVMAAWAASEPNAMKAAIFEDDRATRALLNAAQRTPAFGLRRLDLSIDDKPKPDYVPQAQEFRRFQRVCEDFFGDPGLYLMYRALSSFAHASLRSAYPFYGLEDDWDSFRQSWNSMAPHIVATSLVWAGRALDDRTIGKPRKRQLRQAARDLGCEPLLFPA